MKFAKSALASAIVTLISQQALATNGMNLEGYGPIAASMGGASMAYDNGTAAMMNNPATLGLAEEGSRLDLAIGFLGPDVSVVGSQRSGGDAYFMPAAGYSRHSGNLTYGLGMFAQGGMGTEFASGLDALPERSELGVGRLLFPVAYNVNDNLTIGGSLDVVWAMLDVRMAMPFATLSGLITQPGNGTLTTQLNNLAGAGYDYARIDFSDGSDFTGKAKGMGLAGKIGLTYKINNMATIGATYHSKTALNDLETSVNGANLVATDTGGNPQQTVPGKITVRNFQWPSTFGVGVSLTPNDDWMFAADLKRIGWKSVMKNFTMTYSALGDNVTFALPQNWDDQTVFSVGAAYKATNNLTLRAGASLADNPIPSSTLNYLFPAIVEDHFSAGFGYQINDSSEVNFSLQYAPEVSQTNTTSGFTVHHEQTSWQLMYSMNF